MELDLPAKSIDDLERLLRKNGYSHNATTEILKWYRDDNSHRVT